jgi:hypothetical protein
MPETTGAASPRRILVASALALVVAVLVLVTAVLPAEYGIDPLGTGEAFGLLALSRISPIQSESGEYRLDSAELKLGPYEWVEYSYRLEEGAGMLYTWQATGRVSYNLHSAPDGAPPGFADSFDAQESDQAHGTYVAPYSGVHGWYWENVGEEPLVINLTTAGFYSDARETRDRVGGYHDLTDVRGNTIPAGDAGGGEPR